MAQRTKEWFVDGTGIDRDTITENIQRFLGNDATVRPGVGTREYEVSLTSIFMLCYESDYCRRACLDTGSGRIAI